MKSEVIIRFNTDNSAFEEFDAEAARILRELADRVQYGGKGEYIPLIDLNGNQVGQFIHNLGEADNVSGDIT